jgi:acyl carrier protein
VSTAPGPPTARSAEEIRDWIVVRLARLLEGQPHEIDPTERLDRYGLDSVQLILFVTDLEQWSGQTFTENPLNEHPSIERLSQYLAGRGRA